MSSGESLERRCALPSCARVLVRKPEEWLTRFAARSFCDMTCSSAARRRTARVPRVCAFEACATPLVRYPRESSGHFTRRRFCRPQCHQDMRTAEEVVAQHGWEPASSWRKRAACSVSCAVRMRHRSKAAAAVKPKVAKPKPKPKPRLVKAVPPPSQTPPPVPPSVTVWRPSAPGWSLRPGDEGYDEQDVAS